MLIFTFLLATSVLFLQGVNIPGVPLNAFVPWISLFILCHPLPKDLFKALLGASFAGILVDLLSDYPLGLYPISYCLTTAILFRFRNRFLFDKPLHLALFAMITSLSTSILQLFFLFLFDRRLSISGQWILFEWLAIAGIDGIYSLIWFSGPMYVWVKLRRNWVLFWKKMKHSPA